MEQRNFKFHLLNLWSLSTDEKFTPGPAMVLYICVGSIIVILNATPQSFFRAHFGDRYRVMFQMAKSMFFPNFKQKIPYSRNQKKSPFCDLFTALCYSRLYIFIQNVEICLLVKQNI